MSLTKEQHDLVISFAVKARDELMDFVQDLQSRYPEFNFYVNAHVKTPCGLDESNIDYRSDWGSLAQLTHWDTTYKKGRTWKSERPWSERGWAPMIPVYEKLKDDIIP